MIHERPPLRRSSLVKRAPQRADRTIPRLCAGETTDWSAKGVNASVAAFLVVVAGPLVVLSESPQVWEGLAALAAAFGGRCCYRRYWRLRAG
jgi:hypothetical protein